MSILYATRNCFLLVLCWVRYRTPRLAFAILDSDDQDLVEICCAGMILTLMTFGTLDVVVVEHDST